MGKEETGRKGVEKRGLRGGDDTRGCAVVIVITVIITSDLLFRVSSSGGPEVEAPGRRSVRRRITRARVKKLSLAS